MRWLILVGSFAIATLVTSAIAHISEFAINPRSTAVFIEKRMKHIFNSIPLLEKNAPNTVLVWGTSEVEGSFSPKKFADELNRQGLSFETFNLAIRSMDMKMIRDMAEGFQDRLSRPDRRFAVSLLKLPLSRLTKSYARYSFLLDRLPIDAAALDWSRLPHEILSEPERGFSLGIEKLMWSSASPRYFSSWLQMVPANLDFKMQRPEGTINVFHSLWIDPIFLERPEWDFKKSGLYTFNLPSSRSEYDFMVLEKQKPYFRKRGIEHFVQCCDLVDLNFDPILVRDTIDAIRKLQLLSDHVLVIMPPESREIRALRSIESLKRLEHLKAEIREMTGVKIVDWDDDADAFEDRLYIDFLHMTEAGWELAFPRIAKELKGIYARP